MESAASHDNDAKVVTRTVPCAIRSPYLAPATVATVGEGSHGVLGMRAVSEAGFEAARNRRLKRECRRLPQCPNPQTTDPAVHEQAKDKKNHQGAAAPSMDVNTSRVSASATPQQKMKPPQ